MQDAGGFTPLTTACMEPGSKILRDRSRLLPATPLWWMYLSVAYLSSCGSSLTLLQRCNLVGFTGAIASLYWGLSCVPHERLPSLALL